MSKAFNSDSYKTKESLSWSRMLLIGISSIATACLLNVTMHNFEFSLFLRWVLLLCALITFTLALIRSVAQGRRVSNKRAIANFVICFAIVIVTMYVSGYLNEKFSAGQDGLHCDSKEYC